MQIVLESYENERKRISKLTLVYEAYKSILFCNFVMRCDENGYIDIISQDVWFTMSKCYRVLQITTDCKLLSFNVWNRHLSRITTDNQHVLD